jgi:hypothetical protein
LLTIIFANRAQIASGDALMRNPIFRYLIEIQRKISEARVDAARPPAFDSLRNV